jgi:hypothetical protein
MDCLLPVQRGLTRLSAHNHSEIFPPANPLSFRQAFALPHFQAIQDNQAFHFPFNGRQPLCHATKLVLFPAITWTRFVSANSV